MRLTTPAERAEIRRVAEERTQALPDADLGVLGWSEWVEGLERGLAAHHAGLLPAFKETVEELFRRGLVKMVFATETLALGVNMPARSVVLEKLVKWNGEQHVDVTAGEYTQLTGPGRAARHRRRGPRGRAVERRPPARPRRRARLHPHVPAALELRPDVLHGRQPRRPGRPRRAPGPILEMSFAQFQADRGVVGLARQVRKQEEALAGYTEAMTLPPRRLRVLPPAARTGSRRWRRTCRKRASADRRADAAATLERLRRGDVIDVPSGQAARLGRRPRPGPARRRAPAHRAHRRPAGPPPGPGAVPRRRPGRHHASGCPSTSTPTTPRPAATWPAACATRWPRSAAGRRAGPPGRDGRGTGDEGVTEAGELELVRLRRELRAHPCHGCADREDHARWAQRRDELERDHRLLQRKIEGRTAVIARTFDRVCEVLDELGYLRRRGAHPGRGAAAVVYTQSDLLVAECLRTGIWDGLDGPALAAVVSTLVFEARREVEGVDPRLPGRGTAAGVGGDRAAVVGAHRRRGRAPGAADPRARPRLRRAGVALGAGPAAGDRAARERPQPGRLRPLVPADPRPARPGPGLGPARQQLRASAGDAVKRVRRGVVEYSLGAAASALTEPAPLPARAHARSAPRRRISASRATWRAQPHRSPNSASGVVVGRRAQQPGVGVGGHDRRRRRRS